MDKNKLLEELKVLVQENIVDPPSLNLEEHEIGLKLTINDKEIILKAEEYNEFNELKALGMDPEKEFAFALFNNL